MTDFPLDTTWLCEFRPSLRPKLKVLQITSSMEAFSYEFPNEPLCAQSQNVNEVTVEKPAEL